MRSLLRLLILFVLLAPARAGPFEEGDFAAKTGMYHVARQKYEAALQQAASPADRQLILLRLLALAQQSNQTDRVYSLADELRKQKLPPEIEMRVNLIEGLTAYRLGNIRRAQADFQRARALANGLGSAGASLGRSECESFEYMLKADQEGIPTPEAYGQACAAAFQTSTGVAPTPADPYWPMDILRSTQWSQLWGYKAWVYSVYDHLAGVPLEQNKWGGTSIQIYANGMVVLDKFYKQTNDPEFVFGGLRLGTELVLDFPLFPPIKDFLANNEAVFYLLDQQMPAVRSGEYVELDLLRARHERGKARFALYHGQVDQGVAGLERAAAEFERLGSPVDQIDSLTEIAYQGFVLKFTVDRSVMARALDRAEAAAAKANYPTGRFYTRGFQGYLAAEKGDLPRAEQQLELAVRELDVWLAESGANYRAKQEVLNRPETRLFKDALLNVLIKQGKSKEALESDTQMTAQSQLSGLDLKRVKSADPRVSQTLRSIEEQRTQGEEIKAELRAAEARGDETAAVRLRTKADSNKAEFYKLVNDLRSQDPEFERVVTVKPASFASLQSRLPANAVLVQFGVGTDTLRTFVATSKELKIYQARMDQKALEQLVRGARRLITGGQVDIPQLAELYDLLFKPIEADLAGKELVILVPNGPLYYVPFAALKGPGGYLVENHALVTATSADVLDLAIARSTSGDQSLLALANPDRSLPGAHKEVEQLSPLFAQRETYYEDQATKARLKPVKASILHLATHGFLDGSDVNESYLLLAGSDSKLTNGDIYALELQNVSLVTLSACQTQLGERNPLLGNDVATIAQAFSIAGCRSILASLWKVDDTATARLMVEFYTQLVGGKSKSEALRQAQIKLVKAGLPPVQWAAFQLIGDWQ